MNKTEKEILDKTLNYSGGDPQLLFEIIKILLCNLLEYKSADIICKLIGRLFNLEIGVEDDD